MTYENTKIEHNSVLGTMIIIEDDTIILPDVGVKIAVRPLIKKCKICGNKDAEITPWGVMCYSCMNVAWRETEINE